MKWSVIAGSIAALALAMIVPLYGSDWVFNGPIPGGHRGPVNAVIHKGDDILSAGADGFLETWNSRSGVRNRGQAAERFQVSTCNIIAMAGRPDSDDVCLVENDGMGLCLVSVWNYKERRKIFSLPMGDPIAHVSYSTGGNFIIAARTGRTGLVFIDSASGVIRKSPESLSGTVGLAVTGKSERNMLVYFTSGELSYWDIESGNETNHFDAPANIRSPVLFSNNRYLAGIGAAGLMVINAISGDPLAQDDSVPSNALLCAADNDFICLTQKDNENAELYRYTIDRSGRLRTLSQIVIPSGSQAASTPDRSSHPGSAAGIAENNRFTAIAVHSSAIALGNSSGLIVLADMNGHSQTLGVKEQICITDADVSGATIAFLTENGIMGFIPLNYSQISASRAIGIEQNTAAYNRITAFAEESGPGGQFIFWQNNDTRIQPLIRSSNPGAKIITLGDIKFRSPIRLADSFEGRIMFLDSMGNLSILSPLDAGTNRPGTAGGPFTFFSVGLMDAAFVDRNRLIIGRSAVSGNTPFMMINVNTGETVPLPYPCQAVVSMYRGASGSMYAAAVFPRSSPPKGTPSSDAASSPAEMPPGTEPSSVTEASPPANTSPKGADGAKTSILQIDPANIANSLTLINFDGEDTQFSLVESPGGTAGSFAATIGGEEASIYSSDGIHKLDRTAGLPHRLIDGGQYLISLDRDGSICWHDNQNGTLLAVFRLHSDGWTLQTEQRTISGKTKNNEG